MKKQILLFLGLFITGMMHALTVASTPGGLSSTITTAGGSLATVIDLTVTGNIDARDFKAIRDNMPQLAVLDLSSATIVEYTGAGGTAKITNMTYPANEIPQYAFLNQSTCKGKATLTNVTISSTVTSIGSFAFNSCRGLTSITIPFSVKAIGEYAFYGCVNLISIYVYLATPINLGAYTAVFGCVNIFTCRIYVPAGSKAAYKTAEQWRDFRIIEINYKRRVFA